MENIGSKLKLMFRGVAFRFAQKNQSLFAGLADKSHRLIGDQGQQLFVVNEVHVRRPTGGEVVAREKVEFGRSGLDGRVSSSGRRQGIGNRIPLPPRSIPRCDGVGARGANRPDRVRARSGENPPKVVRRQNFLQQFFLIVRVHLSLLRMNSRMRWRTRSRSDSAAFSVSPRDRRRVL